MRLALLALAALVWIAVPVSARAEGETVDTWDGTVEAFTEGSGTNKKSSVKCEKYHWFLCSLFFTISILLFCAYSTTF